VSEETSSGDRPIGPDLVEIVPDSVVELLVTLYDRELAALRSELDLARRAAEEVEERLRRNPVAAVYDEAFEARVLEQVANIALSITHEDSVPFRYAPHGADVPAAGVRELKDEPVEFAPVTIEPEAPVADFGVSAMAPIGNGAAPRYAPPPPPPPAPPTPPEDVRFEDVLLQDAPPKDVPFQDAPCQDAPRHDAPSEEVRPSEVFSGAQDTLVVPIVSGPQPRLDDVAPVRPRTVVVDRSWPVSGSGPIAQLRPEPEPFLPARAVEPMTAPIDAKKPTFDQEPTPQANARSGSRWLTKVPSRLLIQLGALVIIVGLLVLKLG
jgi:hypothetical protein